uniref:Membrane progestin receptor alpha n=1 Tax=Anthurium amnicola TaxID=1678845 RepID=A0A1D1Z834_9ARAE
MQQLAAWDEYVRRRENRWRVWGGAALLFLFFMAATPKIPHSPRHHLFADMRNFLGVPNTLNVLTSFPLLVVGVVGFVLCLHGNCFGISVKGEIWGWAFFYAGVVGLAFGSAYYHLKPDDARVIWERFPMMISIASLFSTLVTERLDQRLGLTCLFSLMLLVLGSIVYERTFNDLRLCMMFMLVPSVAIPAVAFMFPPKYTHSRYWFWAAGFYLLAKFEAMADMKAYSLNHYIISGHSLEHLILASVPVLLTAMLWCRNIKIVRDC